MTSGEKIPAVQPELFDQANALPASIVVGPFGIAEEWLARALRLSVDRLHAWHGEQLGAPRDYRYHGHYFYTAAGVQRILELAGIDHVMVVASPTPPAPSGRGSRRLFHA